MDFSVFGKKVLLVRIDMLNIDVEPLGNSGFRVIETPLNFITNLAT